MTYFVENLNRQNIKKSFYTYEYLLLTLCVKKNCYSDWEIRDSNKSFLYSDMGIGGYLTQIIDILKNKQ